MFPYLVMKDISTHSSSNLTKVIKGFKTKAEALEYFERVKEGKGTYYVVETVTFEPRDLNNAPN